jgi:SAM-dependent methyltransferase
MKARARFQALLRRRGKDAFVSGLPLGAAVFDVGCGNNSPERVKSIRPDVHYVGLDVADYVQTHQSIRAADDYRITSPSEFAAAIAREIGTMDAVISSHNLEHCADQASVLSAMCGALKPAGKLYLSFPCAESVRFPSRRGTLRFSDDPTHVKPPDWSAVLASLSASGMKVEWASARYRPAGPWVLGALLEPVSFLAGRVMPLGSTWALWGFESVLWAVKESGYHPDAISDRRHV